MHAAHRPRSGPRPRPGAALLLIAVANAHLFLHGHGVGVRGYPPDPGAVEQVITLVQVVLVDGRAYPLFGVLFGYGLGRIAARPGGRAAVRRRGRRLLLLGLAHGALLFSGDVLGAYGLLGLLFGARIVAAPDTRLLRAAAAWLLGPALAGAVLAAPVLPGQSAWLLSMTVADPRIAVAVRVAEWVAVGLVQALGLAASVLVGAWVARRGVLDEPSAHRRLLVHVAVVGLAVAVAGALPLALMAATLWTDPSLPARLVAGAVHGVTGYGGGLAYTALAALVFVRFRPSRGAVLTALIACGRRSLSCYLVQSVVIVAVLAPYGGGWGDRVGLLGAGTIAVATWAATVLGADVLRRRGCRGPAESWLRRRPPADRRAAP